jgi:septum formation topological specificity factor MinE
MQASDIKELVEQYVWIAAHTMKVRMDKKEQQKSMHVC